MTTNVKSNIVRVIILDISGIYAQIHDQGYFDIKSVREIQQQYADRKHWHVLVVE